MTIADRQARSPLTDGCTPVLREELMGTGTMV